MIGWRDAKHAAEGIPSVDAFHHGVLIPKTGFIFFLDTSKSDIYSSATFINLRRPTSYANLTLHR
jgi:hypothetical protein